MEKIDKGNKQLLWIHFIKSESIGSRLRYNYRNTFRYCSIRVTIIVTRFILCRKQAIIVIAALMKAYHIYKYTLYITQNINFTSRYIYMTQNRKMFAGFILSKAGFKKVFELISTLLISVLD